MENTDIHLRINIFVFLIAELNFGEEFYPRIHISNAKCRFSGGPEGRFSGPIFGAGGPIFGTEWPNFWAGGLISRVQGPIFRVQGPIFHGSGVGF